MTRTIFTLAFAMLCNLCFAQEDSTSSNRPDTIRIGNMIIIKKAGKAERQNHHNAPQAQG